MDNRKKLRTAFQIYCGIDYFIIETMDFVPGWTNFTLNNVMRLDVMMEMKGLENKTFEEYLLLAQKANIENVIVPVLHIDHLLLNKKAVNGLKTSLTLFTSKK